MSNNDAPQDVTDKEIEEAKARSVVRHSKRSAAAHRRSERQGVESACCAICGDRVAGPQLHLESAAKYLARRVHGSMTHEAPEITILSSTAGPATPQGTTYRPARWQLP